MQETLRTAITAFCDNSEEWFSGKDILLFVRELRGILDAHPAEQESAVDDIAVGKVLDSMIKATEKASSALRAAAAELDKAIEQAKNTLASR